MCAIAQAAEVLRVREAAEALELPSLREAHWEHSDVGVTQGAHEESYAALPSPRPAAAAAAEASASGRAARPLRRVTGFFRVCDTYGRLRLLRWLHVHLHRRSLSCHRVCIPDACTCARTAQWLKLLRPAQSRPENKP